MGRQVADSGVDAAAIRAAVDILYDRLLADPAVSCMWHGIDLPRLKAHQRAFLLQALGGPGLYAGRDMQTVHQPLGIGDEQFTATLVHLTESLREVGVAADVIERARSDIQKLRPLIVQRPPG
jgi:hemoglobin